jgi:hypothetical protein
MKVSEFLRRYQVDGQLPDDNGDSKLSFFAGWLVSACFMRTHVNLDQARQIAVYVSEFIETRVRDSWNVARGACPVNDTFKIKLMHKQYGAKWWENCSMGISDSACLRFSVNEGDPLERRNVVIGWEDVFELNIIRQSRITNHGTRNNG